MPGRFALLTFLLSFFCCQLLLAQSPAAKPGREHLLMDFDWRFAFGHPVDAKKDFNSGTGYFSYFAKASYGDGAAARDFDDRSWRKLDLPHDWAVELPFDSKASLSHGFKAIGRNFPEASVGWYRKTFVIPADDLGRHISIAFDGVFRNSIVWINGFYLGTEASGYNGFEYNISDYLNYGGENTIAVRVDATMEEGWFYEGAGIYRHTWLNKTAPVHVAANGTFVTSSISGNKASVTAAVTIINEGTTDKTIDVKQTIVDAAGKIIASAEERKVLTSSFIEKNISSSLSVADAVLWSTDNPYRYKLITEIAEAGTIIDRYETRFGIRSIRFDANEGFFLNGKHLKLQGTNNHQDHAGVGTAMPDALMNFRISALRAMGCNAYRCSHNPPAPELLDACDSLGMLVIDENRLMGVSTTHLADVKRMILRDRNHPSIISWSIGNEEWGIEGNILGARIATTMQAYTKSVDSTRAVTAAISGGWREGISNVIDVMGANYIGQINTDEQHQKFPWQPIWGTEEGSTRAARGVYEDDTKKQLIAAYDKKPFASFYSIEEGWKHYASRKYLAGMFIWTGFDYRGEPTPFGWPSTLSYFGMMDNCGFPKDNVYYLRSWWMNQPLVHILPHWNWPGKEGKEVDVWVYSNCDEVELLLNKKSLGKKVMPVNSHLEWKVKYQPGTVEAIGYKNGKRITADVVKTTSEAVAIDLLADKKTIKADKEDIAILTVAVKDKAGLNVPVVEDELSFSIQGPGKIIGVGNGNPASTEADRFLETISTVAVEGLKEKAVAGLDSTAELAANYDDVNWQSAFTDDRTQQFGEKVKALIYRGNFILPANFKEAAITLYYVNVGKEQSLYINGKKIAAVFTEANKKGYQLDASLLHAGKNSIAIAATPLLKKQPWDVVNMNPGLIQLVYPAATWKRKLFNGLAQVIVQSTGEPGDIIITAKAASLKEAVVKIAATPAVSRPQLVAQ